MVSESTQDLYNSLFNPDGTPKDTDVTTQTVSTPVPDPLSATQTDFGFQREAKLTGEEEDYKASILQNDQVMSAMRRYMFDRFGEDGKQDDNETDEDFYDRYMNHHRYMTMNSFSLGKEISFLRDASPETKAAMGTVYSHIENNAPDLWDQELGDAGNTFLDYASAVITDPLNMAQALIAGAFTGGAGAPIAVGASRAAASQIIKKAITVNVLGKEFSKHALKGTVSHAALAGAQGALEDAMLQELEMQGKVQLVQDEDGNTKYEVDPTLEYEDMKTNLRRVGLAGGFSALLGAGEGLLAGRAARKQTLDYYDKNLQYALGDLDAKVDREKLIVDAVTNDPTQGDVTSRLLKATDLETEEAKEVVGTLETLKKHLGIDETTGVNPNADADRKLLDAVGTEVDTEPFTQAQLRATIAQKMGKIASDIVSVKVKEFDDAAKMGLEATDDVLTKLIIDGASAANKKDGVATDLVVDIFKYLKDRSNQGIEGIDEVDSLLQASGRRQDFLDILTKFSDKTFEGDEMYNAVLKAYDESLSQAGRTLQASSPMGKVLKEHGSFTREQRKQLDEIFGTEDGTVRTYESLYEMFNKFGRVRRSLMTITPATTARNIFSGLTNITFATAANTIESIIYNMGKVASDSQFTFGNGLRDIWLDSSGMLLNLYRSNASGARAMIDMSLINDPTLARKLFRNNAEFGEGRNLPAVANFLNGLNIASDGFFRRTLFAYELDKSFRRAGFKGGMDQVLMEGKTIPSRYLQKAAEETLKGTFSYSFKKGKGVGEDIASTSIDFIEKIPMGTVVFPFARFMFNAMAFQYQYSPLNAAANGFSAIATATANLARKEKKKIDYAGLSRAFSRGTVGTAALYAAIQMRSDQQENPYWKLTIGDSDIDTRPLFPLAPYLLVADFIVKTKDMADDEVMPAVRNALRGEAVTAGSAPLGLKEVAEAIAGLNIRSTAQLPMFDALFSLAQQDETGGYFGEDKVGTAFGEFFSAYAKSPFVGANFFKDVMASFNEGEAVIRDTKANVEGFGFTERATSAFGESLKGVLPVAAQEAVGLDVAPVRKFAYRENPAYRQNTLAKQTLGTRMEIAPNDIEAEMNALGLPEWQKFKPSGDRVADSYIRQAHSEHMLGTIRGVLSSDQYRGMSREQRSIFMNNLVSATKKEAKKVGEYFNIKAIQEKLSEDSPKMIDEIMRLKEKNPAKAYEILINLKQRSLYTYTGPFARMRWLDNVDKRTKALVNSHLKTMYEDMLANGTLNDTAYGQILQYFADKDGPENLTIEKTGLYGLGHELGKAFKGAYKP